MAHSYDQRPARCSNCGKMTLHMRQRFEASHGVHLLITLLLCGLWLPFWIIDVFLQSAKTGRSPWLCQQCGQPEHVSLMHPMQAQPPPAPPQAPPPGAQPGAPGWGEEGKWS